MNEIKITTMYVISNSYSIRDDLKKVGGKWDAARKAWIISEESYNKLNSRSASWGMAWSKGWDTAKKEKFEARNGVINFANPIN